MLIDDIKGGETAQLEFKEVPNRDSAKWLKTVVAFANGRGGRIVFGVANDRRVIGLKCDLFALYDDRLEVTSPGKLPYGVTVAKMMEGCSECRNKALAQALAYMNIIEDWGSGIPRISADIREAGLRDIEISAWPNAVRTVIFRQLPPSVGGKDGGKKCRDSISREIIALMRENPKISVSAIVSAIGGGKRTIERAIAELKAHGQIVRKGTFSGEWRVIK